MQVEGEPVSSVPVWPLFVSAMVQTIGVEAAEKRLMEVRSKSFASSIVSAAVAAALRK